MFEAFAIVGFLFPSALSVYLYMHIGSLNKMIESQKHIIDDCNSAVRVQEKTIISLTKEREDLKRKIMSYSSSLSKISDYFGNDK